MRRHAGKAGHSRQQLLPITACCLRNCEEGNDGGAQVSDRARCSTEGEVAVELEEDLALGGTVLGFNNKLDSGDIVNGMALNAHCDLVH